VQKAFVVRPRCTPIQKFTSDWNSLGAGIVSREPCPRNRKHAEERNDGNSGTDTISRLSGYLHSLAHSQTIDSKDIGIKLRSYVAEHGTMRRRF